MWYSLQTFCFCRASSVENSISDLQQFIGKDGEYHCGERSLDVCEEVVWKRHTDVTFAAFATLERHPLAGQREDRDQQTRRGKSDDVELVSSVDHAADGMSPEEERLTLVELVDDVVVNRLDDHPFGDESSGSEQESSDRYDDLQRVTRG